MHLLLILAIALIIVGPAKLPELGSGIGKAIRGFRRGLEGELEEPPTDRPR
jgi:sec-independent protein translocase protein TatA